MSIVAIVNLAERLLNHSSGEGQDASATPKQAAKTSAAQASDVTFEDQFTSSVNGPLTGPEPGLFRVNRFAIFSAAANFFLAHGPEANPPRTETPAPTATKTQTRAASEEPPTVRSATAVNAANPSPVAAVSVPTTQPVITTDNARGQLLNTGGPTLIPAPAKTEEVQEATSIPESASSSAQPNAQSQLQTLNSTLAALGISAADIAVVDRIAALIKDFNPKAFSSLVQQLEFLALSQAPAAGLSGSALTNPSNGLQIQELIVRFSAVDETLQSGNPKTGVGTTVQVSAFNLQIEGVRIAFTNHAGKTVRVETPQAATSSNAEANSTSTKTLAATA